MAKYRRLAAFCLVLLSSANIAFGKIRGTYYDPTLEVTTSDGIPHRQLMKGGMKGHKGNKGGGREKGSTKSGGGEKGGGGGAKGGGGGEKGAAKGGGGGGGGEKGGGKKEGLEATMGPTDEHTAEPEYTMDSQPEKTKGGKKGGVHKGGKNKGGKTKDKGSSKDKSGKYKGSGKQKGGGGAKGGSNKASSGKAVEKKSRSEPGAGKSGDRSQHKLKKSSSSKSKGSKDESVHYPEIDPTLVEVPMSFYFQFEEKEEERRRLDGHTVYQPQPEELETLKAAVMEYAVGLFDFLHEAKPDTFYSVTPTIEDVIVHPDEEYQLQVDVIFHILYNEAPENAPEPHEVAEVLVGAFTTQEFIYYYLWGHDDIWQNVSSIKVEHNLPEGEPEFSDPEVDVFATMVYGFGVAPTSEATEADYDTLVSLTEDFFSDLLTDLYKDNTDTNFEDLAIERHATTFDLASTPPVMVDFAFNVEFDEDSAAIPSSDDLFSLMAEIMFDDYIRLYLEPSESIWSTVDRVGLLELMPPGGETPEGETSEGEAPEGETPEESDVVPTSAQGGGKWSATMVQRFYDGKAQKPSKEDYDKLQMATNFFFIETLTNAYSNSTDTKFLMATTEIESTYYDDTAENPLQVDYITAALFEGVTPENDTVFGILQGANYDKYIMEYLWPEGAPWSDINGVMYTERIPARRRS